jgi:hypothetical protein
LPSFAVTAAGQRVNLDAAGSAQAPFTVTNTAAQTLKARLLARPSDPAKAQWLSIVGEASRDFAPNASEQVVVQLDVPPGTPPGSYAFRLDAVSEAEPDEDFTEGPSVAFEVAPPPQPKKKFPWWIAAVAGGVVLLIIIGVVVFLLVRGDGGRSARPIATGTGTITGTFHFDVDVNRFTEAASRTSDLFWQQQTAVLRQMVPENGATLVNLGVRDFDSITGVELSELRYSTAPIPGNALGTNLLVPGDVFAVRSTEGNFAKVKVVTYARDLGVQWVTFSVED